MTDHKKQMMFEQAVKKTIERGSEAGMTTSAILSVLDRFDEVDVQAAIFRLSCPTGLGVVPEISKVTTMALGPIWILNGEIAGERARATFTGGCDW